MQEGRRTSVRGNKTNPNLQTKKKNHRVRISDLKVGNGVVEEHGAEGAALGGVEDHAHVGVRVGDAEEGEHVTVVELLVDRQLAVEALVEVVFHRPRNLRLSVCSKG